MRKIQQGRNIYESKTAQKEIIWKIWGAKMHLQSLRTGTANCKLECVELIYTVRIAQWRHPRTGAHSQSINQSESRVAKCRPESIAHWSKFSFLSNKSNSCFSYVILPSPIPFFGICFSSFFFASRKQWRHLLKNLKRHSLWCCIIIHCHSTVKRCIT